jgi:thiol-disulfide isomerase/thioredoxin
MKHSLLFGPWIYPAIWMVAIWGLITIASCRAVPGTGNRLSSVSHTGIASVLAASRVESHPCLDDEGRMPDFDGAVAWLNTAPLNGESLRVKVVLVNFWTYSCINSLRALPYMKSWAAKYKEDGLVVIGVHTPEFPFEKESANVGGALRDYKVTYPVALDSNYAIWHAFNNEYWPAFYFIDGRGKIRYYQFGEGDYDKSERVIQELLKENGATDISSSIVSVSAPGAEAAPDLQDAQSPETYIGYQQAERFVSSKRVSHDSPRTYYAPRELSLNQWGLSGHWNIGSRSGVLQSLPGKIVFRFHSRDLHLVLGPSKDGKPVRFRVTLDGAEPGSDSGTDVTADGNGEVREYRLYQLVRQKGSVKDRTFEIEFLDSGVQAFSFTFG